MPKIRPERPGIVPLVRQGVAAGVPEHVRVGLEGKPRLGAHRPLDFGLSQVSLNPTTARSYATTAERHVLGDLLHHPLVSQANDQANRPIRPNDHSHKRDPEQRECRRASCRIDKRRSIRLWILGPGRAHMRGPF